MFITYILSILIRVHFVVNVLWVPMCWQSWRGEAKPWTASMPAAEANMSNHWTGWENDVPQHTWYQYLTHTHNNATMPQTDAADTFQRFSKSRWQTWLTWHTFTNLRILRGSSSPKRPQASTSHRLSSGTAPKLGGTTSHVTPDPKKALKSTQGSQG